MDSMQTQRAEFDAADEFVKAMKAIQMTAVVDDDYPGVRHRYESTLNALLKACHANGRDAAPQPAQETSLTFARLRLVNVVRCNKWHPSGIAGWSNSDWMTALTGEVGELASFIKMQNRERDHLPGNKAVVTQEDIAKEMADIATYLDLMAAANNIDLAQAIINKFNEVSIRVGFPDRL